MGKASWRKRERKSGITPKMPGFNSPAVGKYPLRREWDSTGSKMSAAILEVIEPFIQDPLPLDRMEKIVGLGCLAWNISLSEKSEIEREIQKTARAIKSADASLFEAALRLFVARKLELFPNDERSVVEWKVRETREKFSVTVLAAVTLGG